MIIALCVHLSGNPFRNIKKHHIKSAGRSAIIHPSSHHRYGRQVNKDNGHIPRSTREPFRHYGPVTPSTVLPPTSNPYPRSTWLGGPLCLSCPLLLPQFLVFALGSAFLAFTSAPDSWLLTSVPDSDFGLSPDY